MSLIIWWGSWILVAAFWRMIYVRGLWEDGREIDKMWWRSSSTSFHLIGIFVTAIQLTTKKASGMHFHQLKIHGWHIGGGVRHSISFWTSQSLIHFLFYATFYNVGYVGRECLRYWIFVKIWCGKLLTIYALENGGGGGSWHTPFIGWLLHQVTQEDIIIGCGFALQKLSINSTSADLNAGGI